MRVVRVLPDVTGIDKTFDYVVPDTFGDNVRIGTMVRIDLHGRRVGGWVVADDVAPVEGVVLKPLAKVTGYGPPSDVIALAEWAAWRWAGRPAHLLRTASPDTAVRAPYRLAHDARRRAAHASFRLEAVDRALAGRVSVLRWPPGRPGIDVITAVLTRGPTLILHPSGIVGGSITTMASSLTNVPVVPYQAPGDWSIIAGTPGVSVVGTRRAVFAPMRELAAVVVLDAHDEGYKEERTPAWDAVEVAVERARRAGVPCVLVSPTPSLELVHDRPVIELTRADERAGWPTVEVVDRRSDDPRSGLFSERLVHVLRGEGRVVCVLNRTGRARLLGCAACGELARCDVCEASVAHIENELRCGRCGATRPVVCAHCGGQRLKVLRAGVTRVREDLEALVGERVEEVTGTTEERARTRVVVGTEAVLHRVRQAEAVVFLDFDQELLAPRYRAAEDALALVARAARRTGGRASGGRVLLQTRLPEHPAVLAAANGDPARLLDDERPRRELLRFPPFTALAAVSGAGADEFIDGLRARAPASVELMGPSERGWLVRAPDHTILADALAGVPRPAARTRVEVDPRRV